MKRLILLVAALYPRSWREEFGEEFSALLDDVKPRWRVFANVLGGAIRMQMTMGKNWLKLVVAMAVVAGIIGGGLGFRTAPQYVSSAVIAVKPVPDPVRPTSPAVLRKRMAEDVAELQARILSRAVLGSVINDPALQLYKGEQRRMPFEDVITRMRRDIRFGSRPSAAGDLAPLEFDISFSYSDPVKAQLAVKALISRFMEENVTSNLERSAMHKSFWRNQVKPAPPAPVGEIAELIDTATLPTKSSRPYLFANLARSVGLGVLLGLLAALIMRWPRASRKLGGFALAGCAVASAVCLLIPSLYTSTATMEILPAAITEDPLAQQPPATPATEFLSETEQQVTNFQSLSKIIQDRSFNLYSDVRGTKPMEEVVGDMRNNLHITPSKTATGMFSVSFTYSDRFKAQQIVTRLINSFEEANFKRERENAPGMSRVLWILDIASLPIDPVAPNRYRIGVFGLCGGLVLGGTLLFMRRSRAPVEPTGSWRPVQELHPS